MSGGVAGGIAGTDFSITRFHGPRERAFMIPSAAAGWIAGLIYRGLVCGLPVPYRWSLWIPCSILLPLGILCGNRKPQALSISG